LHVTGLTDTDAAGALVLRGIIGAANPTDTNAAIIAAGGKYNATGTTWQALGDAETVFQLKNYTTDLITVLGDGKVGVRTSTPTVAQVEIYGATNTNTLLAVGPGSSVVGSEILRVHDLSGGAAGMSLFKVTQGNTVASPASTYFTVVYGNNIGIGTATFGTSAAKVLAIALGTAPTTSPADAAQVWVQDQASIAGKASLHMRNEAGNTGPVAFAMGIVTSHGATETATADTLYGNTHLVTGAYTVTLPAVSVGMKGRFLATTAATFSVDCNAADHFVLGGTALTAGNKVTSDGSAGAFFEWEVTAANTITITFSNVTFTDGGA
jgi:hypothetical protein